MPFKVNLLNHVHVIHECAQLYRAEARMLFHNMFLYVGANNRQYYFQPQFVASNSDRLRYSPHLTPDVTGFIGWLPYFNKRWPTGSGKRAFKQFCTESGVATPQTWRTPMAAERDYVIKTLSGSFGIGMRGPFREGSEAGGRADFTEEHYCEEFIRGRILKAWYWDGRIASLEASEMPTVVGNGVDSVETLVNAARRAASLQLSREILDDLCAYQSVTPQTVLPSKQQILVDIRYGSRVGKPQFKNSNVWAEYRDTAIGCQLTDAGPVFWESIPEEMRQNTLFTLDAIADDQDKVWFLEMNCNPSIHPDVYRVMFEGLFGQPVASLQLSEGRLLSAPVSPASYYRPGAQPAGSIGPGQGQHAAAIPGLPPGMTPR